MKLRDYTLALLGGTVVFALFYAAAVLLFSFGDEGTCVTAPYRFGSRPACVEVKP